MDLIEQDLQAFVMWWNHHRIRKTRQSECPPGVPDDLYSLPEMTGKIEVQSNLPYPNTSGTSNYR